jgi:hypothetical protein
MRTVSRCGSKPNEALRPWRLRLVQEELCNPKNRFFCGMEYPLNNLRRELPEILPAIISNASEQLVQCYS